MWEAIVRLPSGFITGEASNALVELDRHIRNGFRSDDELFPHALKAKRALTKAGLYGGPHTALNYLKELETAGYLIKRLVNASTLQPIPESDRHRGGTYQWFWVGEPGMPVSMVMDKAQQEGWI